MNRDDMRLPPTRCYSSSSITTGNFPVENDDDDATIFSSKYFPFNGSPIICNPTHSTITSTTRDRRKEKTHSIFSFLQRFRAKNSGHGGPENVTSLPSSPRSVRYTIARPPEYRWESVESVLSSATAASFAFVPSSQPRRPAVPACIPQQPLPVAAVSVDNTAFLRRKYNLLGSDATLCSHSDAYFEDRRLAAKKKLQRNSVGDVENLKAIWGSDGGNVNIANRHRPKSSEYVNTCRRVHCHRPGKRRAPQPPPVRELTPIPLDLPARVRKKRKAPSPPTSRIRLMENSCRPPVIDNDNGDDAASPEPQMYNDSLKLERGQLKANKSTSSAAATTAMTTTADPSAGPMVVPVSPKPWYKRSASRPAKSPKSLEKKKSDEELLDEWMLEAGLPRSSSLYERQFVARCSSEENSAQATKRKSQVSMLANISELDREAAQIVRKEREREMERANTADEKFYSRSPPATPNKLNSDVDANSSRRHASKELISILNAINNVTKITVNTSFFKEATTTTTTMTTTTATSKKDTQSNELQQDQKKSPNRLTITELDDFDKEHTASGTDVKKLIVKSITASSSSPPPPLKTTPPRRTIAIEALKTSKPPFSSWMCPQCTLENPSWKFICEACNLWRPYSVTNSSNAKTLITPKEDATLSKSTGAAPAAKSATTAKKLTPDTSRRGITHKYKAAAAAADKEKRVGKATDCKLELIEEVRKARLAFFEKYILNGGLIDENETETETKLSNFSDGDNARTNRRREELAVLKGLKENWFPSQSTKRDRNVDTRETSVDIEIFVNESAHRSTKDKDHVEILSTSGTSSQPSTSDNRSQEYAKLSPTLLTSQQANVTKEIKQVSTLAVNRLLKKLQTAIANGHHHEAANIAKELARLRIRCCVIRQESPEHATPPADEPPPVINLRVQVKDDRLDRGTFAIKLSSMTTIREIREKIRKEFDDVEIVKLTFDGKMLDDGATLECIGIGDKNDVLFAYASEPKPETKINNTNSSFTLNRSSNKLKLKKQSKIESTSGTSSIVQITDRVENANTSAIDDKIEVKQDFGEKAINEMLSSMDGNKNKRQLIDENQIKQASKPRIFGTEIRDDKSNQWICLVCTLINEISEENCAACSRRRPQKYTVNDDSSEMATSITRAEQVKPLPKKQMTNYLELVDLEKTDLIANVERFNCFICLTAYEIGEGVTLKNCLHTFCRECLSQTIEHSIEAEIKCPYRDADYSCESTLQEREIKALVKPHIFEKHLARSVSEAENKIKNAFHCKTANCPGWCIFEDNVNEFHCPVCDKVNCLTCQVIHMGLNCKQYQEVINKESETNADANRTRLMLQEMLQRGEAMTCPTCQVILMKKWGCDWLRCTMCKTEICWVTKGPRWGPKGKGDISGGCRCGVNGAKCHQRCTFCH